MSGGLCGRMQMAMIEIFTLGSVESEAFDHCVQNEVMTTTGGACFDIGPFLGLEVSVMPHLLAWFGVTKDRKQGTRFMETIDDERQRFSKTYQLVRNWNVETLLGHLSPERARNIELEGQVASKYGEEIRALKRENARLRRENQDLLSWNECDKQAEEGVARTPHAAQGARAVPPHGRRRNKEEAKEGMEAIRR
ncbi:hypothetical protein THAOC_09744 [Thalassiosira oceanica]|uniref:Uncharacterized protein n=1 Tax=Thalassiosira oceanica TaxID=159749 RepID=K0SUE8_THAOC|nr:hypothetical protein THAOC_09744 [Thalassiosira oceanica]|eukprot:EJK69040.1 hypothetical protein THAOC_09744 [Thalassiosira oceanica]